MKHFDNHKNIFKQFFGSLATLLFLLLCNYSFAQKRGEKVNVTKSATVDFKTMEKFSKEHPTDPNEKRIAGIKNGANEGKEEGEEEEEELPILKSIPKGAKIVTDPFGKMPDPTAGKPNPGTTNQTSFAPITNFNAIDDVGSVIPPDVGGQVGPNHVMTTLNGTGVRIQNRTGGVISTVTLNAFFASVGAPSTFDPKVMYDPYNGRWIVVACGNAASASSALLVGVSANNDPTGTWKLYSLDVDATNVNWFDYPSIGFTKDWVVITGNMFTVAANSFSTGKLYAYKKSDLYAAVAAPAVTSINGPAAMCPAITYDNSISTMYILQTGNGNSGGNGFVGLATLTGAVGSEVLSATTFISTPNPWANGAPAANFAPQSGTANKVACNDTRMQKVIYRNGSIWGTHTIFLPAAAPTRSSVQWWQLSTASAILQRGRIDDGTGANFYAFPCIDVNKNNDAMIGCAKFSGTTFPSACYALRMASDSVNTFQADFVYKAGLANYFKTFSGTTNRWGDYTSVCVDPVDDMNFWTVQEYARTGNLWGTWWAGICTPPPTPGAIQVANPPYYANSTGNVFSVSPVSGATSYTWTFPAGCTITAGANTNSVTVTLGSTSGNVTVVANKAGCNSNARAGFLPIVPAPPLTDTASNSGPICQGGTLNLFASANGGIPPYSYSWTGPNSFTSNQQNPTIANIPLANAGTYTVTVTDSRSPAVSASFPTNVTVDPIPVISASANPTVICSGSNAQLTAYQYTPANSTPPTYCVTNLSNYNACANPGGSNITNVAIASTTLNSNTVCNFTAGVGAYTNYPATGSTTATLIAGQTYTIAVSNNNGNGIVSMWIDYNRNGTFEASEHTQVYTNALSGSVSFTVPPTATLGVTKMRLRSRNTGFANGAGDACSLFGSGTVEDYTITLANTSVATYFWSPSTFLADSTSASVAAIAATTTTTYTVTAISTKGCTSSATTTLTVNPLPTIIAAASPDTICLGFSSTLTASATAGPQSSLVYAAPGSTDNTLNDHITLLQFNNLNNPTGAGGSSYEDFTGTVPATTVNPGQSVPLTVNVADGGGQEFAAAWFDWNRNGIYEPSEFVNVPLVFSAGTYIGTVTITVPSSAKAGVIHMRVRSQYNVGLNAGNAYSIYTYGETEEYLVNVFRPVATFMWYPGAIVGNPITVSPINNTTYQVVGTDANGCVSDTASVQVAIRPIPGNPAVFGNNSWNVYAYDGVSPPDFTTGVYKGYYTDGNINIATDSRWDINGAPSDASGYVGCPVGADNHSWSAKRLGFPCGYYQLDIPGHDDDAELYINGTLVFSHYGCCDAHTNVWTGWLGASDSVEYRVAEGFGESYGYLSFISVAPPALLPITGGNTVCLTATKQLSNASPGTGNWSSSDITKVTVSSTGVITGVAVGSAIITYSSTAPNGCAAGSISTTITVLALPNVSASAGSGSTCVGTTTQLTNSTPGGTWSTSNPLIATVSNTGLVTGIASGSVTITYTTPPNANGCTRSTSRTQAIRALPTVTPITGLTSVCIGSSTTLANATPGGTWNSSNTSVATVSSAGFVNSVTAGTTTISYTTAANSFGCTNKATVLFTVYGFPTLTSSLTPPAICSGSVFNYPPTSSISGSVITWTRAAVDSITNSAVTTPQNGNPNEVLNSIGKRPVNVVYVFNVNNGGCSTNSNVTVAVNPPIAIAPVVGTTTLCVGNSTTLTCATPAGTWSSSTPATASVSAAGVVTAQAVGTTVISYSRSDSYGCTYSSTATVTVNAIPAVGPITGTKVACINGNGNLLGNSTPGGVWTSSDTTKATINSTTGLLFGKAAGSTIITYTVTAPGVGCVNSISVSVSVLSSPNVSASTGSGSTCLGGTTQLANSTAGGTWSTSNPTIATISSTGLVTGVSVGVAIITYTTPPNANGCTRSTTRSQTVRALPVVAAITGPNGVCLGGSINLSNATSGGTWSSSNPAVASIGSTGIVTGNALGTVTITYTSAPNTYGCVGTSTYNVGVYNAYGIAGITAGANPICSNKTTTLTATGVTGASPIVTWWTGSGGTGTNLGTGTTLSNAVPGVYYAYVSGSCGSSAEAVITIGSIAISTRDTFATACGSFVWRGNTYTATGNYNFVGVNAAGCDSIVTLRLTINKINTIVTKTNVACFGKLTGVITDSAISGTPPIQYKLGATGTYSSTKTFSGLKAGSYYVYVRDSLGCTTIDTVVITQPATAISATATVINASCPGAANGSITVNPTGGIAPYTYRNGTGGSFGSSNVFSGLKAGSYRIYIIDAAGCSIYSIAVAVSNVSTICPSIAKTIVPVKETGSTELQAILFPNPSNNLFTVKVKGKYNEPIMIRVLDVNGKTLFADKGLPNQSFRFGESFISGTYLVEIRQGEEVKTLKAVKAR